MIKTSVAMGLGLLWVGAVAYGALLILRGRWQAQAAQGGPLPSPGTRQGIEALCLFAGSSGCILGLCLLAFAAVT